MNMILLLECHMRCTVMTQRYTRALSSIVATLVFCTTSCVSAEQYSYQLDETFRIYHDGQLIAETDSSYVRESSHAFTWGEDEWNSDAKHYCYLKQTNQFIKDLEWAYTNEYGVALKYKTHFELLDSDLNVKTMETTCGNIYPLPIDGYAMLCIDNDFDIKWMIKTKNQILTLPEDYSYFDGGVVFTNEKKEIEVLGRDGSRTIVEKKGNHSGAGQYLWITNINGITLLDSNLTPLFFQKGYFTPLSIFVDGKAILMDRTSITRYLFDVDTQTLTEITDTNLSNSEILYGRRVFTARSF